MPLFITLLLPLLLLFQLLLVLVFLPQSDSSNGSALPLRPIRVALSIDDHSLKDLIILMNSVIESAIVPVEDIVFHVVACSKDAMGANMLKRSIESFIQVKRIFLCGVLPARPLWSALGVSCSLS